MILQVSAVVYAITVEDSSVAVQHKDFAHHPFSPVTKLCEPYAITTRKLAKVETPKQYPVGT